MSRRRLPQTERRQYLTFTAHPSVIKSIDYLANEENTTRSKIIEMLVGKGMKELLSEAEAPE